MNFAIVLLALGGFLLGGAWSAWSGHEAGQPRSGVRILVAVIFVVAALLATASGILRLI